MRLALLFAGCAALVGCISGAPQLTEAQNERLAFVGIYKPGETPGQKFSVIGPVEAADCSGGVGRLHGSDAGAIEILKKKAVALGADAVTEVSCAGVPLLNNCWAARKCTGNAVRWD